MARGRRSRQVRVCLRRWVLLLGVREGPRISGKTVLRDRMSSMRSLKTIGRMSVLMGRISI